MLLIALALIWKEPLPALHDIAWGGFAGLAGAIGLISFYSALSIGRMGIAAPVSAILTASLPVLFGVFTEGMPSLLQLGGFVLALLAIGLISRPERAKGVQKDLGWHCWPGVALAASSFSSVVYPLRNFLAASDGSLYLCTLFAPYGGNAAATDTTRYEGCPTCSPCGRPGCHR